MTPNTNTETGLPYGVVAGNSLRPEVAQDLWLRACQEECDAYLDTRENHWQREIVDSLNALGGSIDITTPGVQDLAHYMAVEDASDFRCEEPCATFTHEGITVAVSYLGGVMLVTSVDGPPLRVRSMGRLCTGAADIDSGYGSIECHAFPVTWFTEEAWTRLTNLVG